MGRNRENLEETKKGLPAGTACDVYPVSVTDVKGLRAVSQAVGEWDVLILNAGTSSAPSSIADADIDEWWSAFEVFPFFSLSFFPLSHSTSNRLFPSPSYPSWPNLLQTNTRGPITTLHSFLGTARPSAAIINVTSGSAATPPMFAPGLSSYAAAKLASSKILEYVAAEQAGIFVASLHPGCIDTATFRKSGSRADLLPMDTGMFFLLFYFILPKPLA